MKRVFSSGILWLSLVACGACGPVPVQQVQPQKTSPWPATPKVPVTNTYHGVSIVDEYQWLENWEDEEVKEWSRAQNAVTRSILDNLPGRVKVKEEIEKIYAVVPASYKMLRWSGGKLFALKFAPPANQPMLVIMDSPHNPREERILVDPNLIDKEGTTHIDWYRPSPDGSLVAISMSKGGSENGDASVYEVKTGKQIDIVIKGVYGGTAAGDLEWSSDAEGFYYTRYPRKGERPDEDLLFYQKVWYHKLGAPESTDTLVLGQDWPRIASAEFERDPNSNRFLVTTQKGDSGQFGHYVRGEDGKWTQLSTYEDRIIIVTFGAKGDLYIISQEGAPNGKVLRLPSLETPMDQAELIIEEGEDAITTLYYGARSIFANKSRLYVTYQLGGPSEVRAFYLDGRPAPRPEVPAVSNIGWTIVPFGDHDLLFQQNSFLDPPGWFHYEAESGVTKKTALASEYPLDFSDATVTRDFAISKDGTKIPVNIVHKKDIKLDGNNPVLMAGYGAYGYSYPPRFDPLLRIWLDRGGIYVRTNLRGGGEYGEEWHHQGNLTRKQNVFDDMLACMEYMFDKSYTTPDKLALIGGSNGGLLMAAMITQHPSRIKAVVSFVGIYDMLRMELTPNGSFNVPEFGTVTKKDEFEALYAYSPYHNVKDGTPYPHILFITGENDNRVDPMHSRKMTARLQAASGSANPIMLRTSATSGHGGDTGLNEKVEQKADYHAFLFNLLGMD